MSPSPRGRRGLALRWGALRSAWLAVQRATEPGAPGTMERLRCLPRLVRGTVQGTYPGTSRRRLLLQVAALVYLLSPIDLVPERLLAVLGVADDAVVLAWLASALVNDTQDYLAWEARRPQTVFSRAV